MGNCTTNTERNDEWMQKLGGCEVKGPSPNVLCSICGDINNTRLVRVERPGKIGHYIICDAFLVRWGFTA